MAELEAAWAAIHENTLEGWYVDLPGYEERYGQWSITRRQGWAGQPL